jgi:toxin ParE1/3/4
MATKVTWLRAALDDLDNVLGFIEKQSPTYATIVGESIIAAVEDLALFPLMGPQVRERDEGDLRQRLVYRYRVIYRVKPDRVEIVGIVHGSRPLPGDIIDRR